MDDVVVKFARTKQHYKKCIDIINTHNNLSSVLSVDTLVLGEGALFYVCKDNDDIEDDIIGCIYLKKCDWYLGSIKYLSIKPEERGKQYSRLLLAHALKYAYDSSYKMLLCTIREGNVPSEKVFTRFNFTKFDYMMSNGRRLNIYNKLINESSGKLSGTVQSIIKEFL